jgi:hypothetical protein
MIATPPEAYGFTSFLRSGLERAVPDVGNETFYLIFCHVGPDKLKTWDENSAIAKAEELAAVNPGKIFIIMKAEKVFRSLAVKVTKRDLKEEAK